MVFYVMIIISLLYLLFREHIIDLKDTKTILFGMLYILIMLWLDFNMDFTIKSIYIKYLIYYGLLILTVGMISTDKKKAVFYTFNVLLIANVVNYLTIYMKLWYWYNNEIFNFLIPIITFILYHSHCICYSISGLVWSGLSLVIWEVILTSDLLIITHHVSFIVFVILIVWIAIHRLIILNNK